MSDLGVGKSGATSELGTVTAGPELSELSVGADLLTPKSDNSDINVPTSLYNSDTKKTDTMQLLKSTLTSMLQTFTQKPNFDVKAAKRTLKTLLDTGSIYITNFKRNEHYKKKINSFKSQDDITSFIKSAVDNFNVEFAHETTRGSI